VCLQIENQETLFQGWLANAFKALRLNGAYNARVAAVAFGCGTYLDIASSNGNNRIEMQAARSGGQTLVSGSSSSADLIEVQDGVAGGVGGFFHYPPAAVAFGGDVSAASVAATGAVSGASVAASGAVSGASAAVSGLAAAGSAKIGGGATILKHLSATKTWDPASTADGAMTSTTITVTGAAVGDTVAVGFTPAVPAGALLTGAVTAADTVTVTLFNKTGGVVDLASGTLRADVWQH